MSLDGADLIHEKPITLGLQGTDEQISFLTRIDLTLPAAHAFSSTAGVIFQEPLPLFALRPGQSVSAASHDCAYRVSAFRAGLADTWKVVVAAEPSGPGPHPWLTDATLTLATDSSRPPFHRVTLRVTGDGYGKHVEATVKVS